MPQALSDRVQIHLHLPQSGTDGCLVPVHQHIHLHLHATGTLPVEPAPILDASRRRPLLSAAMIAGLFFIPVAGGLLLARHAGITQATAKPAVAAETPSPTALPPAVAQQLARPPSLTPPPGMSPGGGAPSGPAAFGLN